MPQQAKSVCRCNIVFGPNRTFTATTNAAVQLSHCGHSCFLQHFVGLNVGVRTKPPFNFS
jgi:hypothetical protein